MRLRYPRSTLCGHCPARQPGGTPAPHGWTALTPAPLQPGRESSLVASESRPAPQPLEVQPSREGPVEIYGGYVRWGHVLSQTLSR